jgi:hypothetical protein
VILDEAHHARRQTPQNRNETPNRLLQLMQQLKEKSRSLLLLSPMPMQINTIFKLVYKYETILPINSFYFK